MDPSERTPPALDAAGIIDVLDLRAAIAEALVAIPVDEEALRRGVWTYVGAERHMGTTPGHVIMALTDLVDGADIHPLGARHALTRRMILWCVEAYFGHLGGDVVGREREALSDSPARVEKPVKAGQAP